MKKKSHLKYFFFLLLFPSITPCFAQWTWNTGINTPVCTATNKQIEPRAVDDGIGGFFVAWKDYRNSGISDVYVQHIDSNGIALWATDGVPLCTNLADQSSVAIVSDMAGGVIVSWSDWRSGIARDIYAQRINAAGIIQWTTDGVVVTNKVQREHDEKIISDDAGGAIVVWEEKDDSTLMWSVWAQRINSNGIVQWPAGGIPMASANGDQLNPRMQKDGNGGGFLTWQDYRNGSDYDIYCQHVSSIGTLLWGPSGLAVCNATESQNNPKIDPDSISGGVFISWTDKRNTVDDDIYCQLVDSMGNMLWANNGVPVCTASDNQDAIDILSNNRINGIIVTWKDYRAGNFDIYTQRLNRLGVAQWTNNGIQLTNGLLSQQNPNIKSDGFNNAIICWQDSTSWSEWNIMAQKIDTSGTIQWSPNGAPVSEAIGSQTAPKNLSDNNGGSIFFWEDLRGGSTSDIYCHRLNFNGTGIGINEQTHLSELNVFPNPVSDFVNIDYSLVKKDLVTLQVQNILGEIVPVTFIGNELGSIGFHHVQMNTVGWSPGIYFLVIQSPSFSSTVKLLKNP